MEVCTGGVGVSKYTVILQDIYKLRNKPHTIYGNVHSVGRQKKYYQKKKALIQVLF